MGDGGYRARLSVVVAIVLVAMNAVSCTTSVREHRAVYVPPSSRAGMACFRACSRSHAPETRRHVECVRACPGAVTSERATCASLYPGEAAACADEDANVDRVDTAGVILGTATVLLMFGASSAVLIDKSGATQP